jgi:RNA polymerase sigma factor (sigma-70 family)
MDLESLLRAARDGEPGAWAAMTPPLCRRLQSYFAREFHDLDPVELMQRTMVVLTRELPGRDVHKSLEGWVLGVARNQGRREVRARCKDERQHELVAPLVATLGTSPSAHLYRKELSAALWEEIERLPDKYQLAVESYLEGEDIETFAEKHGLKPSTARSHRFRALKILRERLATRLRATPAGPPSNSTPNPA